MNQPQSANSAHTHTHTKRIVHGREMEIGRVLTIFVPYSMACSVWKVPFFPVIPWHMTRVFLSTKTAGGGGAAEKWREEEERSEEAAAAEGLGREKSLDARVPTNLEA